MINTSPTQSQAIALSVRVRGKGFPILCLHGHPGSAECMSVFVDRLSQQFQTIAPDLRGYGNSRTSRDFQMSDHIKDLEALLDRSKIEKSLLLGWSLGGILALELAIKRPERFTGLILIASAARPRGNHPPIKWQDLLFTGLCSIANQIVPGWRWNIEKLGKRSLYRYLLQQHTAVAYQYLAKEGAGAYLQTSGHAQRALAAALKSGYNRLADLPQIQLPCLVLAGEGDRHITAESSLETARVIPDAGWKCYPNTAHLFPWEIPEKVLEDIEGWIEAKGTARNQLTNS